MRRLSVVLGINASLLITLLVIGLVAQSLGVIAMGVDCLGDAGGAGLAWFAIWLTQRPVDSRVKNHPRATLVAALINAGWVLLLSLITIEVSIHRLIVGSPKVIAVPVIVAGVIAALAMGVAALVMHGGSDYHDFNTRVIFVDSVADSAAALGVVAAGVIILVANGLYWVDSAIAMVIALALIGQVVRMGRQAYQRKSWSLG